MDWPVFSKPYDPFAKHSVLIGANSGGTGVPKMWPTWAEMRNYDEANGIREILPKTSPPLALAAFFSAVLCAPENRIVSYPNATWTEPSILDSRYTMTWTLKTVAVQRVSKFDRIQIVQSADPFDSALYAMQSQQGAINVSFELYLNDGYIPGPDRLFRGSCVLRASIPLLRMPDAVAVDVSSFVPRNKDTWIPTLVPQLDPQYVLNYAITQVRLEHPMLVRFSSGLSSSESLVTAIFKTVDTFWARPTMQRAMRISASNTAPASATPALTQYTTHPLWDNA